MSHSLPGVMGQGKGKSRACKWINDLSQLSADPFDLHLPLFHRTVHAGGSFSVEKVPRPSG